VFGGRILGGWGRNATAVEEVRTRRSRGARRPLVVAVIAAAMLASFAEPVAADTRAPEMERPGDATSANSGSGAPVAPKVVGNRAVDPAAGSRVARGRVTGSKRRMPAPGFVAPMAIPADNVRPQLTPEQAGWTAPELQAAYSLPSSQLGQGRKIAVVGAYRTPNLESDLATYRSTFGLPPCTVANGCLRIVGQDGSPNRPAQTDVDWAAEATLDVQMISAICPNCSIVMVEANSASITDMLAAVDAAVGQGVDAVNMSWGAPEWSGQTAHDSRFANTNVQFFAASGDSGTGPTIWPAAAGRVLSVGGTNLYQVNPATNGGRLWFEDAWSDSTGGCSPYSSKPSWQTGTSCPSSKAMPDLSAVAGTATAIYFTPPAGNGSGGGQARPMNSGWSSGWQGVGGTSASSPIVAAAWLLSMDPRVRAYGPGTTYYVTAYRDGSFSVTDIVSGASIYWDARTGLGSIRGPAPRPDAPPVREVMNANASRGGPAPCTRGNPVACATGNKTETFVDVEISGRGRHLRFERTYNALAATTESSPGALGWGWTHSYAASLYEDVISGKVTVFQANGTIVEFDRTAAGTYEAAGWVTAKLVKNANGTWTFSLPDRRSDTFDSAGKLVSQTDRSGKITTLAYNNGRLATVTDAAGRSLTFAYDANGRLTSVTDPIGRVTRFAYDAGGHLISATDAATKTWTFGYDARHRLTTKTNPDGGTTTNVYDANDRVTRQSDPLGRVTTWAYDTNARTTTVTDPAGRVTVQKYNEYHQLVEVTKAVGTPQAATWRYTYAPGTGQLTNVTDPRGNTTSTEWDSRGNVLAQTDPLGRTTRYTYDANGNRATATTPSGATTTYTYTGNHFVASESITVAGQTLTTSYTYSATHPSDLIATTDPRGKVWRRSYDSAGNLVREEDPLGNATTHSYDGVGRRTVTVKPRGNAAGGNPSQYRSTASYDAINRVMQTVDERGATTTYTYDGRGNRTSVTDAQGRTTTFVYDAASQLIEERRPNNTTWRYGYDSAGNRTSVTDGAGKTRSYTYDALDRQITARDPLGRTTRYGYDGAGNRTSVTDPSNRTTTYTYDAANQLTRVAYSDGVTPTVTFTYDADGRRKTMTDGTGTTTYTYDQAGRTTRVVDGGGWAVDYTYDRAGNITNLGYQGLNVARTFDDANRMTSVNDGYGYITRFTYDPDGNVVRTDYHNGVVGTSTFDATGRETDIVYKLGNTTLGRYSYTRNLNGNVTAATDQSLTGTQPHAYSYTPVDQLAAADGGTYSYDPAGNRTAAPGGVGFSYDAADQVTSMTSTGPLGPQTTTFTYDQQGNRTAATGPLATTTYTWDQANRLTRVGPAVRFDYNGDGLRTRKVVGAVAWRHQWDTVSSEVPLLLSDTDRIYIYGPGGRVIEQLDLADWRVHFLHGDQIRSIRLATNDVGLPAAGADYDPFGRPTTGSTTESVTPLGFAGEYRDLETGLVYLRARHYDPTTGQFISRDPLEDTTQTPYAYAENNPVNWTDPTGLWCLIYNDDGGCKGAQWLRMYADDGGVYLGAASLLAYASCPFTGGGGCVVGGALNYAGAASIGIHTAAQCVDWDAYCWRSMGNAGVTAVGVGFPTAFAKWAVEGFSSALLERIAVSIMNVSWDAAALPTAFRLLDTTERPAKVVC
jgi:RHS repeat-associated protein